MSKFKFGFATIVLATALSAAAYAAPSKGGGGGHPGGGGGGHPGGGGGGHPAGGGGHVGGGGGRPAGGGGGGVHVGGGGVRGGGGGAPHVGARPAISRSSAAPISRGNGPLAVHAPSNNSVGQRTLSNSTGNEGRKANVNANVKSHAVRNTLNSASVACIAR